MKYIVDFIYEARLVELDQNLKVDIDYSRNPNTYIVIYTDKRGKEYKGIVDNGNFEIKRYADEVLDIIAGATELIQKSWQDKLIKWVKQYPSK